MVSQFALVENRGLIEVQFHEFAARLAEEKGALGVAFTAANTSGDTSTRAEADAWHGTRDLQDYKGVSRYKIYKIKNLVPIFACSVEGRKGRR